MKRGLQLARESQTFGDMLTEPQPPRVVTSGGTPARAIAIVLLATSALGAVVFQSLSFSATAVGPAAAALRFTPTEKEAERGLFTGLFGSSSSSSHGGGSIGQQCDSAAYAYCCGVGTPCECSKGMSANGQCGREAYVYCCDFGTPCQCSQPSKKVMEQQQNWQHEDRRDDWRREEERREEERRRYEEHRRYEDPRYEDRRRYGSSGGYGGYGNSPF